MASPVRRNPIPSPISARVKANFLPLTSARWPIKGPERNWAKGNEAIRIANSIKLVERGDSIGSKV